jgi:creatinine amidohydrolase
MMAQLTWPELREAVESGVGIILPVGSTEQHGPHLPLGCDSIIAGDLAMAVAEQTDMIVAPTVTYGYRSRPGTGGGQTFVGTTSLKGTTFISLVEDVLNEFIRHGFKRILLLNWHMENQNFIYESAYLAMEACKSPDVRIIVMEAGFGSLSKETMDYVFPDEFPGWGTEHAAIFETSLMLHLHPEDVLFDRAVNDRAERIEWYDVLPIQQEFVAQSGALWKAAEGTAEKGRRGWSEIVDQVKQSVLRDLPKK